MNERVRFESLRTALVLATLGMVLLHTFLSGQVATLLHPLLHPLVLSGGIVLLAAAGLVVALEAGTPVPMAKPSSSRFRRTARDGAVALAVLAAVACAPSSFSALALVNRSPSNPGALAKKEAQAESDAADQWKPDATGVIRLETVDLLMAADAPDLAKELDGRKVRFIGQFSPLDGDSFKMVRFLMFCCAADAQPVSVKVDGSPSGLEKMGWAEVVGTVRFPETVPGKRQPRVTLESATAIPEPQDKFLY